MNIRRAPRPESKFYILDKNISEDERLSWAARGMLIYLLGKPDNWEVSVRNLINQTQNAVGKSSGRDGVRVVLKELEQVGYLQAETARSDGGEFAGVAYIVHEVPVQPETENPGAVPETDFPAPVKPEPAKPAPVNPPQISNEDKQSTDLNQKSLSDRVEEAFGIFWNSSFKNGSKKKAGELFAALVKRTKQDPMAFALVLVNDMAARRKAEQFGFDKLHLTTYLNQERWNDRVIPADTNGSINQDFASKTYESTDDSKLADFLRYDDE